MENWFKHDSTAHTDAKVLQLLMHSKGYYANYWLTLEWLFLLEDATASLKELDSLYYFLRESKEYTKEFIDFCLSINLFIQEKNAFYSTRLKEQKLKQAEKSTKAKESIARRWGDREYERNTNVYTNVSKKHTNVIQNRIEENRIDNIYANAYVEQSSTSNTLKKEKVLPDGLTYDKVFDKYEKLSNRKVIAKDKWKTKIKVVVKTFTAEQINKAWFMMSIDDFLRGKNDGAKDYFTIEYALRSQNIEKYYNDFITSQKNT